jgi:hypothetical protein
MAYTGMNELEERYENLYKSNEYIMQSIPEMPVIALSVHVFKGKKINLSKVGLTINLPNPLIKNSCRKVS